MEKKYYDFTWLPMYIEPTPETKVYCLQEDDTVIKGYHLEKGKFIDNDCNPLDGILWAYLNETK